MVKSVLISIQYQIYISIAIHSQFILRYIHGMNFVIKSKNFRKAECD